MPHSNLELEDLEDAKLARMSPEAYEAKMQARREYNPFVDPFKELLAFARKLFAKK